MLRARVFVRLLFTVLIVAFITPLQALAQSGQPPSADLLAKASADGEVRVIVGVKLERPFQPEGTLSNEKVDQQRRDIYLAQQALLDSLKGYRVTVYARYLYIPFLALTVDEAALKALYVSPLVTNIQEDKPMPLTLASSVPVVGADNVWDAGVEGTGWAVAVLDTGVQWDHPFLGGAASSRIVSEACYSNSSGTGVTLCPNGQPSQTTGHAADPTTTNCINGATNLCEHGTHVAGIAAGHGITFSGIARNANLIAIQVFTRFNTGCAPNPAPCIGSYPSDQISGLQRVYALRTAYNIAAVNMSLGGGQYTDAQQALCDSQNSAAKAAIDNLRSVNIATVIASGNDGYTNAISEPGCISTAVAVGATNDGDAVASFSNSNNMLELLAPGVSIDSSIPPSTYANFQGTSMATPHVAGAWALLKSIAPTATVDTVLGALQTTGVPVLDARNSITKPRIQIDAAAGVLSPTVWLGNTTAWNTTTNWSTSKVPTRIVNVTIPSTPTGGNFPIVNADATTYDLTIANGARITMTAPYTIQVSGNWNTLGSGAFNATSGTVIFRSDRPQTITTTTGVDDHFYHVQLGDSATRQTISLGSNLNISGNLSLKPGVNLAGSTRTITIGGNWIENDFNFQPQTSTVTFNGNAHTLNHLITSTTIITQNFTDYDGYTSGSFTSAAPAGWSTAQYGNGTAGANTWYFGNYTGSPNIGPYGGGLALRWRDGTASNIDAWLFSPSLSLRAGITYQLQFRYGVFSASDAQNLSAQLGNGPSNISMTTQLVNLSNISNTTWLTATQTFTIAGDGLYYLGFRNNDTALTTYGAGLDNISLTGTGHLVFYNLTVSGSGSNATLADDAAVRNNLVVNNGSTLDLDTYQLSVDGAMTNNGTLRQRKNVSTSTEFLRVMNATGATDKYFGLVITPTASALQMTTVAIKGNQTGGCTTNPADALIIRCFAITPTVQQTATIKFYYTEAERNGRPANGLNLWHYDGPATWSAAGNNYVRSESGTTCTTNGSIACWLQAANVSTYSPFGVGSGPAAPTAVRVTALSSRIDRRFSGWPIALGMIGLIGLATIVRRRHRRRA